MPTVTVDKENFFKTLGRKYTTQEFDELCFQVGTGPPMARAKKQHPDMPSMNLPTVRNRA